MICYCELLNIYPLSSICYIYFLKTNIARIHIRNGYEKH